MQPEPSDYQRNYQRIEHFKNWLNKLEARPIEIPDDLIDEIRTEMAKQKITKEKLTSKKLRLILIKLGKKKFYELEKEIFDLI